MYLLSKLWDAFPAMVNEFLLHVLHLLTELFLKPNAHPEKTGQCQGADFSCGTVPK